MYEQLSVQLITSSPAETLVNVAHFICEPNVGRLTMLLSK